VEENGETGRVKATFKERRAVECDLLIGADGIRTDVRHFVVGDDWNPEYTGHLLYMAF
jgi:2-polyprenyl-6-methoxyphenol hydroxylase-like FAD-dependent oxidoreductase